MKKFLVLALVIALPACSMTGKKSDTDRVKDLNAAAAAINTPTVEGTTLEYALEAEKAGNLPKAEGFYKQLLDSKPDNPKYIFGYAEIMRKAGRCSAAIPGYDNILKNDAGNIDAMEGKGLCLLSQGKNQPAADIFTRIIAADPSRWKSLNAAGLIFASDKKFNEAAQYFAAAVDASGSNPSVLNNQGLLKALMGNFKDSIIILKDASAKSENDSGQRRSIDLNLALVYGISGNLDLAEKAVRDHLTKPQLYNNMGVYADLAKDKELSKTYLNKALQGTNVYYERAWDNLERVKSEK